MERDGDRRDGQRFEVRQEVRYRATIGRREVSGSGYTLNMSSSGILFSGNQPLCANAWVTVEVSWPVLLDQRKPIKLVTRGRVVRAAGDLIAVRIREWEFRTASVPGGSEPPQDLPAGKHASGATA